MKLYVNDINYDLVVGLDVIERCRKDRMGSCLGDLYYWRDFFGR